MRISTLSVIAVIGMASSAQPVFAGVCDDLWYERNAIYNDNGFCFKTRAGREAFDNSDCYTDAPDFTRSEQRRIDQLQRQEQDYGC
jgi:hypothetical protein